MADNQPRREVALTAGVRPVALGAHLVGSVPLASAEVVFQTVAAEIGDRLRRIPDGETGPRSDWIVFWQLPVFTSQPQLEVVPPGPDSWRPLPRVRLAEGTRPASVVFEALGYAEARRARAAKTRKIPAIAPPNGNEMEITFSEVSALEDTMLSDEQRREDQAEGMVSIECPAGAHIAMRMSIERVEKADEHVGIKCQECGHIFDWEAPKSS